MFDIEQFRAELRQADAEARLKAEIARLKRQRRNMLSAAAGAASAVVLLIPLLAAPENVFLLVAPAIAYLAMLVCFLIML